VADAGRLEIQSTSGERSGLLTSDEINDLALNGRNMLELLGILPGIVSFVDGQVSSPGGLSSIHINGTRGNQHDLTIDGSSNVLAFGNGAVHVTINPIPMPSPKSGCSLPITKRNTAALRADSSSL
jgi:hypothetical protein